MNKRFYNHLIECNRIAYDKYMKVIEEERVNEPSPDVITIYDVLTMDNSESERKIKIIKDEYRKNIDLYPLTNKQKIEFLEHINTKDKRKNKPTYNWDYIYLIFSDLFPNQYNDF